LHRAIADYTEAIRRLRWLVTYGLSSHQAHFAGVGYVRRQQTMMSEYFAFRFSEGGALVEAGIHEQIEPLALQACCSSQPTSLLRIEGTLFLVSN
jgi:hypothetical protein